MQQTNLATKEYTSTNINNIVGLSTNTPYNRIVRFINSYESDNTKKAYTKYYKDMFMWTCGKTLEQLAYQDIKSIDDNKVEDYREFLLKEKKYKSNSVNQMIFACKALFDKFKEKRIISVNDFDLKPLPEDETHYDSLTDREMHFLYGFCLEQKYKPNTKKLYFEFLYTTGLRKNVAQSITKDKIKRKLDFKTQQEYWVIIVKDKGKNREVSITDEFYNRIIDNYMTEGNGEGKLFSLNNITIDKVLKDFCKKYEITRNIVQHSIKGSAGDLCQSVFGDINKTAEFMGHNNIQTAYNNYLGKNRSYSEQASVLLQKEYNIDMLKGLGEDVLIQLIEKYTEKQGRDIVMKLCMEMEKLTD